MFTGLIQRIGIFQRLTARGEGARLQLHISTPWKRPLTVGESIAVNGACLTLTQFDIAGKNLFFDVLSETIQKTSLAGKGSGSPLNMERALCVGDAIGGHMVSGHVDGTGTLMRRQKQGDDQILFVQADAHLLNDLIPKGSVALDGASLTLVEITDSYFSVHLIPQTVSETTLGRLATGAKVNIETDPLAKHVRKQLGADGSNTAPPPCVTWEKLRDAGFHT